VAVSGTFNEWNRQGLPLQRGEGGRWEATVELPFPGRHLYKFIVDGQYWVEDEANPRTEPDSYGGTNSVFVTAEHAFADELASRVFDDLHSDRPPEEKALARSSCPTPPPTRRSRPTTGAAWRPRWRDSDSRGRRPGSSSSSSTTAAS
jgi:hypothetical protein